MLSERFTKDQTIELKLDVNEIISSMTREKSLKPTASLDFVSYFYYFRFIHYLFICMKTSNYVRSVFEIGHVYERKDI